MNGQIDWSTLFFSAGGRTPRASTLIAAVLLLVIAALYEAIVPTAVH